MQGSRLRWTLVTAIVAVAAVGIGSLAVYVGVLAAIGLPEVRELARQVRGLVSRRLGTRS